MEAVTRIFEATVRDPIALLFAIIITGWLAAALMAAAVPALSSTRAPKADRGREDRLSSTD